MKPEEYATLYRRFVTQFPAYTEPFLVATGPRGHSADGDIDCGARYQIGGVTTNRRSRGRPFSTTPAPALQLAAKAT